MLNGPKQYTYTVAQLGGTVAAESSSGSKLAANNENSWQVFMQTLGVAVGGWQLASVQKAKEITTQFQAGEITKQQAQAQAAHLAEAELAAKGAATSEALPLAEQVIVNPITPP